MNADLRWQPPPSTRGESGFTTYLPAIRAHWVLVAVLTLVTVVGGMTTLYAFVRQYEATSRILVKPLHPADRTFFGLGLLRDAGDPARSLRTAATLVETPQAAALAAERLGPDWDREQVLRAVRVEPEGQSNVLEVFATARSAEVAARVANAFAGSALDVRERLVESQLRAAIDDIGSQLEDQPAAADSQAGGQVISRLTVLQAALDAGGDPTMTLAQEAGPPTAPTGPPTWQVVLACLVAGLVLGALAALAVDSLDRRVRDGDELVRAYPLPTLVAVPHVSRRARAMSLLLPPEALDAFHSLRVQLQQLGTKRAILVTSASSGDGKTTTAANLALALVEAGDRVLLMDLDLRNPALTSALGVPATSGLGTSLGGGSSIMSLVIEPPGVPGMLVLPAVEGDRVQLETLTQRLPELLSEALALTDYVIIDSAPLGEVADALRLAAAVDDVVVVARPRHTERGSVQVMRDLLERSEIFPRGMVVIGQTHRPSSSSWTVEHAGALGERVAAGATGPRSRRPS